MLVDEEIALWTTTRQAQAIKSAEITSRQLLEAFAARIERINPQLNAVVTLDLDAARVAADEADAAVARGEELGPLHGVPVTIKDALETAGLRSTGGAVELHNNVPEQDAGVVRAIKDAGAIVFGKTNLPGWSGDIQAFNEMFGTTVNPKISVGFRPTDTLLLRASYGEGFRAPSMSQLYSSPAQSFNDAIDSVRCAATPEGDDIEGRALDAAGDPLDPTLLPSGHACLTTQYQNFTGGNASLDAEESEGYNVGIVFNPIDDLSISLDYYSIDLVDQIASLPLQTILDQELANMGSAQVTRGGNGRINFIEGGNFNLAGTKTNGLDLDLRYSFSAGGVGDFTTMLTWSHVNNFVQDTGDGSGFDDVTFTPDDRIQWNLNWSLSDYSATLIGNYVNSTPIGGGVVLDDWTTWDLQLNYATPWNGRLTIGARNLFDEDPPINLQLGSPFYSNQLHDIFGRVPYIRYTQDL